MIRTYALGFLVPPALMLALGWGLLEAGYMNEIEVLASLATPALVLIMAWAALVANQIANRRSEREKRPLSFAKLSLLVLFVPVLLLLFGGWALQAGYMNGTEVLAFCATPALASILGWAAVLANDIANRRSERRERQG